jgi:hypothetical protein
MALIYWPTGKRVDHLEGSATMVSLVDTTVMQDTRVHQNNLSIGWSRGKRRGSALNVCAISEDSKFKSHLPMIAKAS